MIHLFHPHDNAKHALDVYLDDRLVARLRRGQSADVNGSGNAQSLTVKQGPSESPVLMVTDPGPNGWIAVEVSYKRFRGVFKPKNSMLAEIMTAAPPTGRTGRAPRRALGG